MLNSLQNDPKLLRARFVACGLVYGLVCQPHLLWENFGLRIPLCAEY